VTFDLVILNGRVIGPDTSLDATRNIDISGGSITAISEEPGQGARSIDSRNLVVAPGFIDVHSDTPTRLGQLMKLQGETTSSYLI
jgi:predicted amidohydrolase